MAKKTKKVNKNPRKLLVLLVVVLGLGGLLYLLNQTPISLSEESKKSATRVEKDGTVLDCSPKVAQGKDSTIAQGAIEKSKCLFLGCGDFF